MRSKMVAEFTLEDVYAALMKLLAETEPGVARGYEPIDWDYTPESESEQGLFVLTLQPKQKKPATPRKRTRAADPDEPTKGSFPTDDEIRGYMELRPDLIPENARPQLWGGGKLRDWYLEHHRELLSTKEVDGG